MVLCSSCVRCRPSSIARHSALLQIAMAAANAMDSDLSSQLQRILSVEKVRVLGFLLICGHGSVKVPFFISLTVQEIAEKCLFWTCVTTGIPYYPGTQF